MMKLRTLQTGGKECVWALSFGGRANHLKVTRQTPLVRIQFDTTVFYDDLVAFCHAALAKNWGGIAKDRYNSWLTLNLDAEKPTKSIKAAIGEILKL